MCSSDLVARPGEKLLHRLLNFQTSESGTAIKISNVISVYSHACASIHSCIDQEML